MTSRFMKRRASRTALAALLLAGSAAVLHAQQPSPAANAAAPPTERATVCMEVEVNGQRSPSYSCLTQQLQPAKGATPAAAGDAPLASEAITQRPSNQLGLFNRAATEHRMGNTFGKSAYPQRPPPAAPGPSPFRN